MKRTIVVAGLVLAACLSLAIGGADARECGGVKRGKQLGAANGCVNQCLPAPPGCTLFECAQCACSYTCVLSGSSGAHLVVVPIGSASFVGDEDGDDMLYTPDTPPALDRSPVRIEESQEAARPKPAKVSARRASLRD